MPETTNQKFKITVPITRCYLRKSADGTEKYVVEGMASNTNLDLTGERMAESAIKSMASSLQSHPVLFKNEHRDEWDAEFGEVTALYATPEHQLMMEAELDPDHYRTKTLVKALEKGKKLGLSIGGYVLESSKDWVEDLGRMVKTYTDILLEEISVTGTPAVADTWLTNITKSVTDWKDTPMNDKAPVAKTVEDVEPQTTEDQPAPAGDEPVEAPIPDTTPEPQTDTDEASVTGDEDPTTDTEPVTPDAPVQEDDPAAPDGETTEKSAPAPAEEDTSEVTKSAVFGDWAQIDATVTAIQSLSWTIQDFIWMTMIDSDKSAEEKVAAIDAGLTDFHTLALRVVSALVQDGNTDALKSAAEAFKASAPEAVAKSLTEKDAKVEELTKTLSDKTDELATAQKSLDETTQELEKIKTRKAIVFDKFTGQEAAKPDQATIERAAKEQFANFVVHGAR